MSLFSKRVVSVSQLNEYIKGLLQDDMVLRNINLRGEISGCKRHTSGHMYFSIKDDLAVMRCVMFKQNAMLLRFSPVDGQNVVLAGYISMYPRDGTLQFYCDSMKPDGVGALFQAYEERKAKLQAEGLFDLSRKQKLPYLPQKLAVVTSATGAAVHDILRVAHRRHPGLAIVVVPTLVQGEGAAQSIAQAIEVAGALPKVEVIICGRGGGSMEDLWAFNEEIVVRAIVACRIPIVSAVGHESDTTLSDFAADVRAATPSQAAELVVPDISFILERKLDLEIRMQEALKRQLARCISRYERARSARVLSAPHAMLAPLAERFQSLKSRMVSSTTLRLDRENSVVASLKKQVHLLGPLSVLERGYAILQKKDGTVLRSTCEVTSKETFQVHMADGNFLAKREV